MNVLLHICCAPCATACLERLKNDGYDVAGFFYNPNIQPRPEYEKRLQETMMLSSFFGFSLLSGEYDQDNWLKSIHGLENEPEGGKRCEICYRLRLIKTASIAERYGFEAFTTTLSVSPHKDFKKLKRIGEKVAEEYGLTFLSYDFKKKDGFKRSIELSRVYNLYRQKYCGCLFSRSEEDRLIVSSQWDIEDV